VDSNENFRTESGLTDMRTKNTYPAMVRLTAKNAEPENYAVQQSAGHSDSAQLEQAAEFVIGQISKTEHIGKAHGSRSQQRQHQS